MSQLPRPDPDAAAHCARVAQAIRQAIAESGGAISFARYMELALYAPGLGYYAAGATKIGAAGDFVTAPEMTPLFGAALAAQIAAILKASARREILELGAGSGRLAASVLASLARDGALPEAYCILEPSPDLRARQQRTLVSEVPAHASCVRWIDALPDVISGAVIANEVLDAIAAHVVRRSGDALFERNVAIVGAADAPRFGLGWTERPAAPDIAAIAAQRFPEVDDYTSEVNPAAEALVADIARRLRSGAVLLIDYGFPAREYYHPQRSSGTLMCHYRHRAHDDPFFYPGLCDITTHVDFTAMAAAATAEGVTVAGYAPLAAFLIGCGLLDRLAEHAAPESVEYMKATSAVQRLVSPAEMGELFKVLALTRTRGIAWPGFSLGGGRHRL